MRNHLISLRCIYLESSTISVKGIKPSDMIFHVIITLLRLEKLRELFTTVKTYSSMGLSHIEGVEQLNSRFNLALATLKKKSYDVLDQRKTDFDGDYEDFKRQVQDLNVSMRLPLNLLMIHNCVLEFKECYIKMII